MVGNYKKKTDRETKPFRIFKQAAHEIAEKRIFIRDAANRYGINFMTLHRYLKKKRAYPDGARISIGYAAHSRMFSDQQEIELSNYTEKAPKVYYGLAFDLAIANNINAKDA
ncbi:hypothetical protein JTB14_006950 [Gonioctena quinquepunctata]|nr:hypothetical protein JTB14_006950 [Gonioctena quinquepunctata]